MVLLEDLAELVVGGRADALQLARGQRRLEQIGRIQRTARRGAGTDQGVDLVDEEDRVRVLDELLEHRLQALLEVAAVLGAGEQRAHVEGEHLGVLQDLGHAALDDPAREAFGDRGLADAGFADQQRIVLAPPAQGLDDALDFLLAADQRVDLADQGLLVEVLRVALERAARLLLFLLLLAGFGFAAALRRSALRRRLGDAVGDEIHYVQARDVLLLQEVHRVRILLAEDRHQHVGAGDFLLARGLHVQDRALDHALETQGGLRVDLVRAFDARRVFIDEAAQLAAEFIDVCGACLQHLGGGRIVQQGKQKVFHGDELVAFLTCLDESHVQADFKLLRDHSILLHHACQRMLMLTSKRGDLLYLGRGDVPWEDPAYPHALSVNLEHDSRGTFAIHAEIFLQDDDDEVHRCVIVVQQ